MNENWATNLLTTIEQELQKQLPVDIKVQHRTGGNSGNPKILIRRSKQDIVISPVGRNMVKLILPTGKSTHHFVTDIPTIIQSIVHFYNN